MKKKQILGAAMALLILGHSCKNDEYRDIVTENNGQVQFTSSIGGQVNTRVTGDKWDANDAIGVFMKQGAGLGTPLAANKKFTTTTGNGNFATDASDAIYYPETGNVDFIAYYPYNQSLTGSALPVSVATQTTQAAIDVLYSDNAKGVSATSTTPNLQFAHKLAKVELNIAAGNGVASVAGVTVAYNNVNTTSTLDLATGTLSAGTNAANVAAKMTAQLAEAILLPGDYTGKEVVFTVGAQKFTWTLPSASTFEAGKKYSYNVRLQTEAATEVEVTGSATITDWESVPRGGVNVDIDGNGGVTPDPVDPNPEPGTEQTIFLETFGSTEVSSNTPLRSFTGWDNGDLTFSDPFNRADVRRTGPTDGNNVWLPGPTGSGSSTSLQISGIKAEGYTNMKLTFNMVANDPINLNVLKVAFNGQSLTMPSINATDRNTIYPIEIELTSLTGTANSELLFSGDATNTVGFRIDDVKLVGTK